MLRVQVAVEFDQGIEKLMYGTVTRQPVTDDEANWLGVLGGILPVPPVSEDFSVDADALLDLLDLARRYVDARTDQELMDLDVRDRPTHRIRTH